VKTQICSICNKPKAALNCGVCGCALCKSCAQQLNGDDFAFLPKVPEVLTHGIYCGPCYDQNVAGPLAEYNETMNLANDVIVFFKAQSKETRLLKRAEVLRVPECADRDETVLRLAFQAAKAGYNAIIDVDISAEKVKSGSYQTSKWSGTAFAANIDTSKAPPPERGSPN
jgi:hypothetical protein